VTFQRLLNGVEGERDDVVRESYITVHKLRPLFFRDFIPLQLFLPLFQNADIIYDPSPII